MGARRVSRGFYLGKNPIVVEASALRRTRSGRELNTLGFNFGISQVVPASHIRKKQKIGRQHFCQRPEVEGGLNDLHIENEWP